MTAEFKVTAKDADAVRRCVAEMIRKRYLGTDGSYEEGVIDTISWLLGEQDTYIYRNTRKCRTCNAAVKSRYYRRLKVAQ